jgi:ATP-dependent Clp protease ATP-binding subunit ClpX
MLEGLSWRRTPQVDLEAFIAGIPLLTPREMLEAIGKYGYIGQTQARKAVCLMAYRHINRIRKLYLDRVPRDILPGKENCLLIGPTGCGKTFLVEILFQKILALPAVIVDITSFSETGYIGQDVPTIITRLIHAAGGDPGLASIGIICIDEFDKIAAGHNTAVFSGQGTTKDVTGEGVQRELLKMLEAAEITVPLSITHSSYADRVTFNTADVPFIACGAFSGFKKAVELVNPETTIGFNIRPPRRGDGVAVSFSREDVEKAVNFEMYGFKPELIGRFARIIPFQALSAEDLKNILYQNTIRQYENELRLDGIRLEVEAAVYDIMVERCLKKETGARGLKSLVTEYLEDACFDIYSSTNCHQIRLFAEDKAIRWEIG